VINTTNGIPLGSTYPDPYFGVDGTGQAYSFHSSGITAAFVDGSARYLSSNIDVRVYAGMITRNGGEINKDVE
jgi:prepilin-type processing-associated H-X9-DG protein